MENILLIGATSAIAKAIARKYAERKCNLFLAARDVEQLKILANDLTLRGAKISDITEFKAEDYSAHLDILNDAYNAFGNIDIVLIAHGTLPSQSECEQSFSSTHSQIIINSTSIISLLTHAANIIEKQKNGVIAVITSVAGDRGRQSNYIYGSSKGMISIFLQGLRNRLYKSGGHVIDIKPGFVDTPMTADFAKNFLWTSPDKIASCAVSAIDSKKSTAYTPGYWYLIMLIIKWIPESIFKRMKL